MALLKTPSQEGTTQQNGIHQVIILLKRALTVEGTRGVVPHIRINIPTTLEEVAVSIHLKSLSTVCSLYLSPGANIRKDDILDIINQLPRPFLVLGDFNAKRPLWDKINLAEQKGKKFGHVAEKCTQKNCRYVLSVLASKNLGHAQINLNPCCMNCSRKSLS